MVIGILLSLLIGPYLVLTALGRSWDRLWMQPDLRGRISLALVFVFTGLGHFIQTEPMAQMLPARVPMRVAIIYITGVIELAAAIGLLAPRLYRLTGICLIMFLILVLPANIYAAINRVEMGGHSAGTVYLLIRVPLQLILIGWTYWFAVRKATTGDRRTESRAS